MAEVESHFSWFSSSPISATQRSYNKMPSNSELLRSFCTEVFTCCLKVSVRNILLRLSVRFFRPQTHATKPVSWRVQYLTHWSLYKWFILITGKIRTVPPCLCYRTQQIILFGVFTVQNMKVKRSLKMWSDLAPFPPSLQHRISQLWAAGT